MLSVWTIWPILAVRVTVHSHDVPARHAGLTVIVEMLVPQACMVDVEGERVKVRSALGDTVAVMVDDPPYPFRLASVIVDLNPLNLLSRPIGFAFSAKSTMLIFNTSDWGSSDPLLPVTVTV